MDSWNALRGYAIFLPENVEWVFHLFEVVWTNSFDFLALSS